MNNRFTKKAVTITAFQVPSVSEEPSESLINLVEEQGWDGDDTGITIPTLEGDMIASPGDYIIRGIKGEYYPCKPDIFEASYTPTQVTDMDFGQAVQLVKQGYRVARAGWNGKDMFIFLVNGSNFKVNREPLLSILGEGTDVNYNPHIDLKQANGSISTWSPSNGDALAEDWFVVE